MRFDSNMKKNVLQRNQREFLERIRNFICGEKPLPKVVLFIIFLFCPFLAHYGRGRPKSSENTRRGSEERLQLLFEMFISISLIFT